MVMLLQLIPSLHPRLLWCIRVQGGGRLIKQITSGSMASALAIATLCFWPPDKDEGRAFAFSAKPTRFKISMAWASASWGDLPKTFMGPMVTF